MKNYRCRAPGTEWSWTSADSPQQAAEKYATCMRYEGEVVVECLLHFEVRRSSHAMAKEVS